MDFPPGCVFLDGRFSGMEDAKISVLDWGFLRSDATYDVAHVWKGRFFRLDRHIERFFASAEKLRLTIPHTRDEVAAIAAECVRRAGLDDAYVELIITRGVSPTFNRDPRDAVNRFIAFAIPFGWILRPEERDEGLSLAVASTQRIGPEAVDPRVKNYHWLDLVMGMFEAYDKGARIVVLPDAAGNVTEGPGFNVFVVKNAQVATPERGVLHGITRLSALELLAEAGIGTRSRAVALEELESADEIFITSTAGGIMPVTRLEGRPVGDGAPGPLTRNLIDAYWAAHTRPDWTVAVADIAAPRIAA
jgi:branched-subunit amino acid aminotransferase/4-amino-4-deoxychorismate lyase